MLEALPDWFGEPAALEDYVRDAASMISYFVRDESGVAIGAALVRRHFPESGEVHLIAVDPRWHRHGVGRALVAAIEADLIAGGAQLLQVKTIGPSLPDPHYAETRKFYRGVGFLPLEELPELWPPWPFLILVKPLAR